MQDSNFTAEFSHLVWINSVNLSTRFFSKRFFS